MSWLENSNSTSRTHARRSAFSLLGPSKPAARTYGSSKSGRAISNPLSAAISCDSGLASFPGAADQSDDDASLRTDSPRAGASQAGRGSASSLTAAANQLWQSSGFSQSFATAQSPAPTGAASSATPGPAPARRRLGALRSPLLSVTSTVSRTCASPSPAPSTRNSRRVGNRAETVCVEERSPRLLKTTRSRSATKIADAGRRDNERRRLPRPTAPANRGRPPGGEKTAPEIEERDEGSCIGSKRRRSNKQRAGAGGATEHGSVGESPSSAEDSRDARRHRRALPSRSLEIANRRSSASVRRRRAGGPLAGEGDDNESAAMGAMKASSTAQARGFALPEEAARRKLCQKQNPLPTTVQKRVLQRLRRNRAAGCQSDSSSSSDARSHESHNEGNGEAEAAEGEAQQGGCDTKGALVCESADAKSVAAPSAARKSRSQRDALALLRSPPRTRNNAPFRGRSASASNRADSPSSASEEIEESGSEQSSDVAPRRLPPQAVTLAVADRAARAKQRKCPTQPSAGAVCGNKGSRSRSRNAASPAASTRSRGASSSRDNSRVRVKTTWNSRTNALAVCDVLCDAPPEDIVYLREALRESGGGNLGYGHFGQGCAVVLPQDGDRARRARFSTWLEALGFEPRSIGKGAQLKYVVSRQHADQLSRQLGSAMAALRRTTTAASNSKDASACVAASSQRAAKYSNAATSKTQRPGRGAPSATKETRAGAVSNSHEVMGRPVPLSSGQWQPDTQGWPFAGVTEGAHGSEQEDGGRSATAQSRRLPWERLPPQEPLEAESRRTSAASGRHMQLQDKASSLLHRTTSLPTKVDCTSAAPEKEVLVRCATEPTRRDIASLGENPGCASGAGADCVNVSEPPLLRSKKSLSAACGQRQDCGSPWGARSAAPAVADTPSVAFVSRNMNKLRIGGSPSISEDIASAGLGIAFDEQERLSKTAAAQASMCAGTQGTGLGHHQQPLFAQNRRIRAELKRSVTDPCADGFVIRRRPRLSEAPRSRSVSQGMCDGLRDETMFSSRMVASFDVSAVTAVHSESAVVAAGAKLAPAGCKDGVFTGTGDVDVQLNEGAAAGDCNAVAMQLTEDNLPRGHFSSRSNAQPMEDLEASGELPMGLSVLLCAGSSPPAVQSAIYSAFAPDDDGLETNLALQDADAPSPIPTDSRASGGSVHGVPCIAADGGAHSAVHETPQTFGAERWGSRPEAGDWGATIGENDITMRRLIEQQRPEFQNALREADEGVAGAERNTPKPARRSCSARASTGSRRSTSSVLEPLVESEEDGIGSTTAALKGDVDDMEIMERSVDSPVAGTDLLHGTPALTGLQQPRRHASGRAAPGGHTPQGGGGSSSRRRASMQMNPQERQKRRQRVSAAKSRRVSMGICARRESGSAAIIRPFSAMSLGTPISRAPAALGGREDEADALPVCKTGEGKGGDKFFSRGRASADSSRACASALLAGPPRCASPASQDLRRATAGGTARAAANDHPAAVSVAILSGTAPESIAVLAGIFRFLGTAELRGAASFVGGAWAAAATRVFADRVSSLACSWETDGQSSRRGGSDGNWSFERMVTTFPWGCYLAEGAFKQVYRTWNARERLLLAVSVMDLDAIRASGNEAVVEQELKVGCLASALTSCGGRPNVSRCPNFVHTYGVLECAYGPPAKLWGSSDDRAPQGHCPGERSSAQNNTLVPKGKHGGGKAAAAAAGSRPGRFLYIAMELCEHGDVEAFIRTQGLLELHETMRFFFQMVFAVHAARTAYGMRHYDLKLLNFLLQDVDLQAQRACQQHRPASSSTSGASAGCFVSRVDDAVIMRYEEGGLAFELKMPCARALIVKMADFGTADVDAATLGQPVGMEQFTTLENSPPEQLILGSRARQDFANDTFALGLAVIHLFMGEAPYEEILEAVVCPVELRGRPEPGGGGLAGAWHGGAEFDVIVQIAKSEACSTDSSSSSEYGDVGGAPDDATFYDTFYRYLVLFGLPAPADRGQDAAGSPVWAAVDALLAEGTGDRRGRSAATKCRRRFDKDSAQFSLSDGSHPLVRRARERMLEAGAWETVMSLVSWDPSRRPTMEEVLHGDAFALLRVC